jgi:hypothetical protein
MSPNNDEPRSMSAEARAGWEAALGEFAHQADHLEQRGSHRAAVVLREAIKLARAGGLICEHRRAPHEPD